MPACISMSIILIDVSSDQDETSIRNSPTAKSYIPTLTTIRVSGCQSARGQVEIVWVFLFIHIVCLGFFFSLYNFVSAGDARIKWKCFMFGFMQGLNPSLRVWNHFFIAVLKSKTGWKKKQILERSRGFPNKDKNNFLPWFQMLFIPELSLSMVWEESH